MISVRIVVDEGGALSSLAMHGHASLDEPTAVTSTVCAAVTAIVRACGQAIDRERGVGASGGASRPGELLIEIGTVDEPSRGWLRGVTDVMVSGIGRIAAESPSEVELSIRTRGDEHGS